MTKIVTTASLLKLLEDGNRRGEVIGRALVALFNRQEDEEKAVNDARVLNARGFSAADAKQGSITAKTYLKRRELLPFQIDYWMQPMKNGNPRICKYVRQLNEVAQEKAIRARRA